MFTHGNNEDSIRNMYNAIADFAQLTKELHFKRSQKGTIGSKISQAAKMLQQRLKQAGVSYQVADHTRDLGANFTFSTKPCSRRAIANERLKTSKGQFKKMVQLAKISRRARAFSLVLVSPKAHGGFKQLVGPSVFG